jgi:hypothetical protein
MLKLRWTIDRQATVPYLLGYHGANYSERSNIIKLLSAVVALLLHVYDNGRSEEDESSGKLLNHYGHQPSYHLT